MTTKNLIPRASGEGGIGITDVTWGYGYYDTGNFNKGLFVSGHNITQVIAETVTQGGLGGEWERNVLDIYYNGGNVGIGTTNPGAKLHVAGVGRFDVPEGGGSLLSWSMGATTAQNQPVFGLVTNEINNADRVKFNSDGDSWFNGGNVGIGTTNPSEKLEVRGNLRFGGTAYGSVREVSIGNLTTNGFYDLLLHNAFQGFLIVSITSTGNANIRTYATYSVFGRGSDFSFTLITSQNGNSAGASFALSISPATGGAIRLSNTSGVTCQSTMVFYGSTSF